MALENTSLPDVGVMQEWLAMWLTKYYTLADTQGEEASLQFADLFAENSIMYRMSEVIQGREAIIKSREDSWKLIDRRKLEVVQLFTARQDYSNILVQGKITAHFKSGKEVSAEFTAQIVFDSATAKNPRAVAYRNWGDTAPWVKAMEEKD
ncbi:hypothetical protein B7463_g11928, partial [Scytalidium lignicola]